MKKIGILGGGQLGRMLIQEALNWDLEIHVLDPDPNCPCHKIAHSFTCGALTDEELVYTFGKDCDIVTIEIENVSVAGLQKLKENGVFVAPDPQIIKTIQDKGLQKQFFQENQIPTADFLLIENKDELNQHKTFLPAFLKLRKEGYDGRGVMKIADDSAIEQAFDAPCVLEKKVVVEKELAIQAARTKSGEICVYPPVGMLFHETQNMLDVLQAPAEISDELKEEAKAIAVKILNELDYVGILAIELFLDKNGKLLVNELAPRPHNSGHHTIEAVWTSQYEQHLRAILDLPCGSTDLLMPAVMFNLLGEPGHEGSVEYEGLEQVLEYEGVFVHFYGKTHTRPWRKMGHVTVMHPDKSKVKARATQVRKMIKVKAKE